MTPEAIKYGGEIHSKTFSIAFNVKRTHTNAKYMTTVCYDQPCNSEQSCGLQEATTP